jgi:hypothetical protein
MAAKPLQQCRDDVAAFGEAQAGAIMTTVILDGFARCEMIAAWIPSRTPAR